MRRRRRTTPARYALPAALLVAALGCSIILPATDKEHRGAALPGASSTCNWYGSSIDVMTQWGRQDICVYASVRLEQDEDGGYRWPAISPNDWYVTIWNSQGRRLPFVGLLEIRQDADGSDVLQVVTETDVASLKDGLYALIKPNVTTKAGVVAEIRPTIAVRELRGGQWGGLEIEIPLIPAEKSEITPMPELVVPVLQE